MKPGETATKLLKHLNRDECKTTDVLADELSFNRRQISDAARSLILRGLIERVEVGCYQLTAIGIKAKAEGLEISSGPIGPRKGTGWKKTTGTLRQRVWKAIRRKTTFTISEVLVLAQSGKEKNARSNIERYIRDLKNAQYLSELPGRARGTAISSNGFKRFRLIKDTGEHAPQIRVPKVKGSKELFDRNTGEVLAW